MDDEAEYEFLASGDACGACQALDGTTCTQLPHENCMCQIVPKGSQCESDYQFSSAHWGPGLFDGVVGGEITVTCPDGTTISESFEFNLSPHSGEGAGPMDLALDAFDGEAESLCSECPEEKPFLCC